MSYSKFFITTFLFSKLAYAYSPLDCVDDIARVDKDINIGMASRICSGSWSPEPVACYTKVIQLDKGINRGIAIDLCAGSVKADDTVSCYLGAGQRFNRGIATTLCGAKKQEK